MSPSSRNWPVISFVFSAGLLSALSVCEPGSPAASRQPADAPPIIPLWPQGVPGAKGTDPNLDVPTLTIWLPRPEAATGSAVVVCPGGGYEMLADDHEGKQIAEWFNSLGMAAFVLKYRLGPRYHHPAMLQDASRAIRTVRSRASEWGLDPHRIAIIGFSAGGHLASTAGTHFDAGKPDADDPIERASSRPDRMVLVYPVIALATPHKHGGSLRNLLGENPAPELIESLSNERQVTKDTPPTFLVHTNADELVPAENSILFALALRKAGVPVELHLFERGRHGLGLGDGIARFNVPPEPAFNAWPKLCETWLKNQGFLERNVAAAGDEIRLSALDLGSATQGWGTPTANRSVENHPLTIGGRTFDHGFGTHADSRLVLDLKGSARKFTAWVGVDDETNGLGSVEFRVIGNGKTLWTSGVMRGKQPAKEVDVDLSGVKKLVLQVSDAGDGIDYDHADWAGASIAYEGARPEIQKYVEPTYILTPKPAAKPRINGAKVVGVRPGSPFLYTIAATGQRPLTYQVAGLPRGLHLDADTGIITGRTEARGNHHVLVSVLNSLGRANRELRIAVGGRLALTPPMGWNSWNCFASAVTEKNVRDATDAFVKAGLRDHGWTYINIDDFWMPKNDDEDPTLHGPDRDPSGKINANPRFPNMKHLTDYIHSQGLRAGIYSSPGPKTCGGCVASYKHEKEDAERFAEWGFDYLKYDWCSYGDVEKGTGRAYYKKPYALMGGMLRAQNRDIVFSLCQYGMDNVWEWGGEVDGNCWRTTGDITDSWDSVSKIGFDQAGHEKHAQPGRWNDPDMLVVGWVGWGPALHPTHLTPNEQYTHISLWSLLACPLLIGCDLTKLDDFTLNLLTNDEVISVNQDSLGFQAHRVFKREETEVWAKPLEDGSRAVGLFNLGEDEGTVAITWRELELTKPQQVRDLWRQKDLGTHTKGFSARVPRHGVVLIKVGKGT